METEKSAQKFSLSVPVAIIVAGLMIAGAVFLSNRSSTPAQTSQRADAVDPISITDIKINPITSEDYIRGNPHAKVVLVEFSDTECPFCKQFHSTMKTVTDKLAKDGTLAWVYRNFPITERHPAATKEAEALLCAGKIGGQNGFWNYTDRLYSITPSNNGLKPDQLPAIAKDVNLNVQAFNTCLTSGEMAQRVNVDREDAITSGGNGTPFTIFVAQNSFDRDEVEQFIKASIVRYRFPAEFFAISNDNIRVSVSGAMPSDFIEQLVAVLAK